RRRRPRAAAGPRDGVWGPWTSSWTRRHTGKGRGSRTRCARTVVGGESGISWRGRLTPCEASLECGENRRFLILFLPAGVAAEKKMPKRRFSPHSKLASRRSRSTQFARGDVGGIARVAGVQVQVVEVDHHHLDAWVDAPERERIT